MHLQILWMLLVLAAYANAIALTNDSEEEDGYSVEDPGTPKQPYYDTRYDDGLQEYGSRPTLSDDAIFLPHETYCQYFYAFDGRDSYIYRCPSGYRFDAEKLQCAKTKYVDCGRRKKNTASSEEKHVGINFKCPKWNGYHPHNHYCHLFYSCESKKGSLYMCPPGKVFDESIGLCQIQKYVYCGSRENPYEHDVTGDVETPDENIDLTHHCRERAGVYPDGNYCNKYIRCWYGIGEPYICPKGKLFDEDLGKCRPQNSVYCHGRYVPNIDHNDEPTLVDPTPYKCDSIEGRFKHVDDCSLFFECRNYYGRIYSCPRGKLFDQYSETCRDASEVPCNKNFPLDDHDDEFECPVREGIFRDEGDCSSYYKCKNKKAKRIQCPEGELFDTDWKSCNDASEVTCGDRLLPGDEEEDEENVIDDKPNYNCVTRHGRFTHEEYCNWFYHCKDGKSSLRTCKKGKYYDSGRHRCYDEVNCGFRIPKDDYVIATPKPREFYCPSKSGKFAHPTDCQAYYVCDKYKHKLHHCPRGKLFDDTRNSCADEHQVDCRNRIPHEFEEDESESRLVDPNPRFECKESYGRFDHDEYCDWYYSCQNRKASVRECRSGKYYDSKKRKCHHHKEVTCGHRRRPEDREISTTEKSIATKEPKFICPDTGGKYAHERDCSKFYDCKKGFPTEHKCPKHKLFDVERQSCEDENHVLCYQRIHPDMDPDEPEDIVVDAFPDYKCKSNFGRFTHEGYCHLYYNCHDRYATVRQCRPGMYYDSKTRRCYDFRFVTCDKRKKPKDDGEKEQYLTTTVKPTSECPKSEGKFPHERNCGKFYECKKWNPKVHECPKHKLFDEKSKKCEDEEKVKCGNRIHPDDNPDEPEDRVVDPNPNFVCKKNHGRYAHDNCDWYYHCRDRKSSIRSCYRGKYYDRKKEKCRDAVEVDCDDRKKPEGTTIDLSTTVRPKTPKEEITTEKSLPDISTDSVSTTEKITEKPKSTTTEAPSTTTATTRKEEITTTTPTTKTEEPTTEEEDDNPDKIVDRKPNYDCAGDEGDFGHDSYCHYYYSCKNNKVTLRECPEGKYFDIERGSCEDWYLVSCGDRLTPEEIGSTFDDFYSTPYIERRSTSRPKETTSQEPTTRKPKFVCPSSDGLFPHEKNCGKYYECTNSVAEEKECPKGELFDVEKGVCNDEDDTNCGDRTHPMDDPDNPDKIPDKVIDPEPDFDCTKRHGCFTHEVFCKWYYYCHDKRPEVRECSGDQYFDSTRNKCLEWWMVFCDKRIVPDETTLMPTTVTKTSSAVTKDISRINTDSGKDKYTTPGSTVTDLGTGSPDVTGTDNDRQTGSSRDYGSSTPESGKGTRSTRGRTRSTTTGGRSSPTTPGGTDSDVRTGSPDVTGTDNDRQTGSSRDYGSSTPESGKGTRSTRGRTRSTTTGGRGSSTTPGGTDSDVRTGSPDVTGTDNDRQTGSSRGYGSSTPESGKGTRSTRGRTRSTTTGGRSSSTTPGVTDSDVRTESPDVTGTDNDRQTGSSRDYGSSTPESGKGTRSTRGRTRSTTTGGRSSSTTPGGTDSDVRTGSPDVTGTDNDRQTGSSRDYGSSTPDSGKGTRSTRGRTRSTTTGGRSSPTTPKIIGTEVIGSTKGRKTSSTGADYESTSSASTTAKPITDLCKEEDGDFSHPEDCKKYYTCKDGEYTVNDCPDGTLFDQEMRICYREDLVDCHDRRKPEVTTQTPDDCDEWLRTRTTSADDATSQSSKGTTGPIDEGTGGTESTDDGSNQEDTTSSQNTTLSPRPDTSTRNTVTDQIPTKNPDITTGEETDSTNNETFITDEPSTNSVDITTKTSYSTDDITEGSSKITPTGKEPISSTIEDSTQKPGSTKGQTPSGGTSSTNGGQKTTKTSGATDDSSSEESKEVTGTNKQPTSTTAGDSSENPGSTKGQTPSGGTSSTNDGQKTTKTSGATDDSSSEESKEVTGTKKQPTSTTAGDSSENPGSTKGQTPTPDGNTVTNDKPTYSPSTESEIKSDSTNDESNPSGKTTPSNDKTSTQSTRNGDLEESTSSKNPSTSFPGSDKTGDDNDTLETRIVPETTPSLSTTDTTFSQSSKNTGKDTGSTSDGNTDDDRTGYSSTTESNEASTKNDISTGTKSTATVSNADKISTDVTTATNDQVSTNDGSETTHKHTTVHPCLTHTHSTPAKPTSLPKIDCDENDIDCIEDKTGDVNRWYRCLKRHGNYPHPYSDRLFIRCNNWKPHIKRCGNKLYFSVKYMRCVHED